MVQYIYNANIDYQDSVDKIEFETDYKATAMEFSYITINDVAFTLELDYTNFKTLIDGIIITWEDIRYIIKITNDLTRYELYLVTSNPL